MNEKVILGDGTEFTGRCLISGGKLFIYLLGLGLDDMGAVFDLFYDNEENTQLIRYEAYQESAEYTGYIRLFGMNRENGNLNLTMEREE